MESSKPSKAESSDRPVSQPRSSRTLETQDTVMIEKGSDESERLSTDLRSPKASISNETPVNDFMPDGYSEKGVGSTRDTESLAFEGDEDPAVPEAFQRSTSPGGMARTKGAVYEKVGEEGIHRMQKFTLYETQTRFYLIGSDILDRQHRILKIDRTSPPGHLNIFEDDIVYDRREINQLLNAIDDGNRGTGGMKAKCTAWGLLGFIRFTEAYYMLLISKRAQVAMIGGHYIYQVAGTELIPLTTGSTSRFQKDRNPEEARFLNILNTLDLAKSFYFSYSYNITRSLQENMILERKAVKAGLRTAAHDVNDMFVWNNYLLEPARTALKSTYDWCRPVIHGYIDQASMNIFGRRIYMTIIARRSRFFAGARFLKRGANDLGYVANDVETEQIVSDALTTSFHAPGPRLYANPTYTSYVQHRGSIPLYWTQDNTGVTPKPDIDLNLIDPFYSAAALHFDNLFERYGAPIYVLNLIKSRERNPRESKLLHEYQNAIHYLNRSLPADKKILYEAFDMARASKTRGHDVIGTLEHLAEKVLQKTGFFHNGDSNFDDPKLQNGVARTNCIDCLDRTNACQFVVGKRALGRQLHALGVIAVNTVEYDTDCVNMFTRMFHDHGDAIAIQYGGSHLVNTMSTYRKINQWQSSSRDMVESFKRYYHNSFLDSQRQEAYNLFLGNYIFVHGQPMLWELPTDYYLHHEDPRLLLHKGRRSYIDWYTPENLEPRTLPSTALVRKPEFGPLGVAENDDWWLEYYRPLSVSSLLKVFALRLSLKSPVCLLSDKSYGSPYPGSSPFVARKPPTDHESPEKGKKPLRKGVTILEPLGERRDSTTAGKHRKSQVPNVPGAGRLSPVKSSILRETHFKPLNELDSGLPVLDSFSSLAAMANPKAMTSISTEMQKPFVPADKSQITQWTLQQFYENSLNPSITTAEQSEYERYLEHPQNFSVVGDEPPDPDDPVTFGFIEYLSMGGPPQISTGEPMTAISDGVSFADAEFVVREAGDSGLYTSLPTSSFGPAPRMGDSVCSAPAAFPSYPPYHPLTLNLDTLTPSTPKYLHTCLDSSHAHHPPSRLPLSYPSSDPNWPNVPAADRFEYEDFLRVKENPLDVTDEDRARKRYKAYQQWLKGKSFFRQWRDGEGGLVGNKA